MVTDELGEFMVIASILVSLTAGTAMAAPLSEWLANLIHAQTDAATQEQWHAARDSAAAAFHAALETNPRGLCAALSGLAPGDLSLFDDELDAELDAKPTALPCAASLKQRVAAHWAERGRALSNHVAGLAKTRVQESIASTVDNEPLPSLESEIDPSTGPVLFDGGLAPGQVALTFDDGPHPTRTRRILDILRGAGVRATFFEVGEMSRTHPELTREVYGDHHTVGSHTWSHARLPNYVVWLAAREVQMARTQVAELTTGVDAPFFRFPYGARTKALQQMVSGLRLATFFWNMDSLDWKLRDPVVLFENARRELARERHGIILFHDIQEQTVLVLPHFLDELRRGGYSTVVFLPSRASDR